MSLRAKSLRIEEKVVLGEIFSSDEPEDKTLLAAVLSMTEESLRNANKKNGKNKRTDVSNSSTDKPKDNTTSRPKSEEDDDGEEEEEEEEEEWSDDDYTVIKAYYENEEEDMLDLPNLVEIDSILKERSIDILGRTEGSNKTDTRYYSKLSLESAFLTSTSSHDDRDSQQQHHQHGRRLMQFQLDSSAVNTDSDSSSSVADESDQKQRSDYVQPADEKLHPRKKPKKSAPTTTTL